MKFNALIALIALSILGLSSCTKEKIQEKRLEGKWNVETLTFTTGGVVMDPFADPTTTLTALYEFSGDNSFTLSITSTVIGQETATSNFTGTWDILDEQLTLEYAVEAAIAENGTTEVYEIIELTKKDLSLRTTVGESTVDLKAKKQ